MELRQLRQFYEVCRQGSFSAAGERLYMTQQAVGKSMKQLEDELGVVLFIRIKTGVSLTPQGKYLESRCETLFEFVQETEDQIQQIGAECPLRTRIFLPDAIAHGLASSKELFFSTPFIDCRIVRNDMDEGCLFENETDALISVNSIQNDELMTYPLLNIPFCVVYPAGEELFTKKELTLRSFRQQTLILKKEWTHVQERLTSAFRDQNVKVKETILADSIAEGLALAAAGKGLFLLPEMDYEASGDEKIQMIPLKKRSFSLNLYYIYRKNDNCQKEILRVYEFLKIRLLH